MIDNQGLIELLNKLHAEITGMIDFQKPYSDLLSCLEYIDLMRGRLGQIDKQGDGKRTYGVLRQISQMNKGVIDIGGWQKNPEIGDLLVKITDEAIRIIHDRGL